MQDEFAGQARLAQAGRAGDGDDARLAMLRHTREDGVQQGHLGVASHQRRAGAIQLARAGERDGIHVTHAHGAPDADRLGFPFQISGRQGKVFHGALRVAKRARPDQHRADLRRRLQARRDVDRVARHQKVAPVGGAARRDHLAGVDANAHRQFRRRRIHLASRRVEGRERDLHIQSGPHGANGIVLVDLRQAKDPDDGIADEFFHDPAVPVDLARHDGEIARQEIAQFLGIQRRAQGSGIREIGEQHGHDAPILTRVFSLRRGGERAGGKRHAALIAKARARRIRRAALHAEDALHGCMRWRGLRGPSLAASEPSHAGDAAFQFPKG